MGAAAPESPLVGHCDTAWASPREDAVCDVRSGSLRELWVWAGCVHLDGREADPEGLRELLYEGDCSAQDADVIVLFLSNFVLHKERGNIMFGLLRSLVNCPDEYIFSEDAPGLHMNGVPAELVRSAGGQQFFSSLHVGIHRRYVSSTMSKLGAADLCKAFTLPATLACRIPAQTTSGFSESSDNEFHIMIQEVALTGLGGECHMLVVGANLACDRPEALAQLHSLQRILNQYSHRRRFTSVIVGNFNYRLIATDDLLKPEHLTTSELKSKKPRKGSNKVEGPPGKLTDKIVDECNALGLTEEGVRAICMRLKDPVERRRLILHGCSDVLCGVDVLGRKFVSGDVGQVRRLSDLFELHSDMFAANPNLCVPWPTFSLTSLEYLWEKRLGFQLRMPACQTKSQLARGAQQLHKEWADPVIGPQLSNLYFDEAASQQRTLKLDKTSGTLYVQSGWIDGVGVYRNGSVPASLERWDTHEDIFAFDHVPITATLWVVPPGLGQRPLRVWVAFMKLDKLFPSQVALRQLLYGTPENSASGADIISVYLTDLNIAEEHVEGLRSLLKLTISAAANANETSDSVEDFVFNEDDPGLQIRLIPAVLLQVGKKNQDNARYVSLHVAVRRKHIKATDASGIAQVFDCFPTPDRVICRSEDKNESKTNFKCGILREVLLYSAAADEGENRGHFSLALVGVNFDTADAVRLAQADQLERVIESYERDGAQFAMIIFGDFNTRLVCSDKIKSHVMTANSLELSHEGRLALRAKIEDSDGRMELFREDSWSFIGKDALGTDVTPPPACLKLGKMFILHKDVVRKECLPLPTYKRTPVGEKLSRDVGFALHPREVLTKQHLQAKAGCIGKTEALDDPEVAYFSQPARQQRRVRIACGSPAVLECGWPDGVGAYRHGSGVVAKVMKWEPYPALLGGSHMPVRGRVKLAIKSPERSIFTRLRGACLCKKAQ
eukprot:TRINITY_DN29439_c0_g1_i1.p1 TRINITY_DN29439_c0_g1~~TRINITY_DN29439_c0_g1_i1.p1  ORF type:complete len:954 (-),score=137.22 TRINITY_DN29439_c0_g1_i1:145-3006(-)